ncbi:MAG: hypothetical protein ABIN37_14475 [Burkholderiaceae bacterium]
MFRLIGGALALALCTGAYTVATRGADASKAFDPVFMHGQYTATLDQNSQHWRLLPHEGQDVEMFSPARQCANDKPIPQGVWLVTRDDHGRPELLAPSVTELPTGYSERVQLLACGERGNGKPALSAPQILIDVLAERTGAIYVGG